MAKNYYAVRKGRVPGIFLSWEDCKEQIHGFPGAEYKKFSSLEEAGAFLQDKTLPTDQEEKTTKEKDVELPRVSPGEMIAYVDGSYRLEDGSFSYGAVVISEDGLREFSEAFMDHEHASLRNVAGELFGAMKVMDLALEGKITTLHLYYDYQGIESWATGEWKTNRELTRAYKAFVQERKDRCDFVFHKVTAHSGHIWNDRADRLAKDALNIK